MVIFRAAENINIKTTDGTLIKYSKLKNPSNLFNENIYITTLEDFQDLENVFSSVGKKYKAKVIDEAKVRYLSQFPKELGISNLNEYSITHNLDFKYKQFSFAGIKEEIKSLYLNEKKTDINKQLEGCLKQDITLAVLGNLGLTISEMICACTALRILHKKLKAKFKNVKIDIYLNASENKYFSRDKSIFANQTFINKVGALSIDVKKICEYDFFIDASSVIKRSYYEQLPHIDAWLHKFGIDYKNIPKTEKYNIINLQMYRPKDELKKRLDSLKAKGKTVLFHPFSANITKSIPKEIAISLLKELMLKLPDYTIVSTLKIDSKIDEDRYIDLSNFSKSFLDFAYIISNMTKIITVNTATYHIAEAFFIPTVVIFTNSNKKEVPHNYETSKTIYVEDKSKNYSHFIFENDALIFHKFDGWNNLKASKIIKLLETF
ncbi:hypothetical protein [Halarcobacter anaerophilus]|uniref:hypothetical protein n=1 Tax=Halarcobacter anaerophilus TaxID=877500 RepID=UPI0005C954D6|nr:hypothetical protein [Halarcobacter anaerophilus]